MIMRSKINAKDFDSIQGKYERAALEKIESNLLGKKLKTLVVAAFVKRTFVNLFYEK